MTVQAFITMTSAQGEAAQLLNDDDAAVMPQTVDNPLANNLGYGTLVAKQVIPARVLNDPTYGRWTASLGGLPIHVLDSETLFVPFVE